MTEPPSAPAEDSRLTDARGLAQRGDTRGATAALRTLIDDPVTDRSLRASARVALVEIWLDHEEPLVASQPEVAFACIAPAPAPTPGATPGVVRTHSVSPALEAREAARVELRCAEAAGRDVAVARARIDSLVQRELLFCETRGERPMEGHLVRILGPTAADPCTLGTAPGAFGPSVSALDLRLGVPRPAGDLADLLANPAGLAPPEADDP